MLHGVLAVHDTAQAEARAGGAVGNRGADVALAAVQMAALRALRGGALKKVTAGPRRRAREVAFRVAYQADATGDGFAETWRLRRPEEKLTPTRRSSWTT